MRSFANRFLRRPPPGARIDPARIPVQIPREARDATRSVQPLRPRIEIPLRDPDPCYQTVERFFERGRFLARQDEWEELAEEIIEADQAGTLTRGRRPVAEILAEGARSDAVEAARTAVMRGEPKTARAILSSLEVNLDDMPGCPAMAHVVASAHVETARAWAGASHHSELSPQRRAAFEAHMRVAADLVDQFDPFETGSPLWARVRCDVLDIDEAPSQRVADDYEDLIDLQPQCPDHMRAFGRDLLPNRFGNHEALDREARRTAMNTADVWGMGGYTWVFIGAMEQDPRAFRWVDAEFFIEGLHDILDHHASQQMANRLAAFTGLTASSRAEPGSAQARISEAFNWIAQDHLHELHPIVWAMAATPSKEELVELEEVDLIKRGRTRAVSTIAEQFAPLLDSGRRLIFTPDGLKMPRLD